MLEIVPVFLDHILFPCAFRPSALRPRSIRLTHTVEYQAHHSLGVQDRDLPRRRQG